MCLSTVVNFILCDIPISRTGRGAVAAETGLVLCLFQSVECRKRALGIEIIG